MLLYNGHLSYKKDGKFMFIRLCESLDFPAESLSALENAYVSVTENPEVNILFKTAVDGLIYINPYKKVLTLTLRHSVCFY